MKRYEVRFNDGELFKSFNRLKDAKNFRANNNFNFINRCLVIYDNKVSDYIR